MKRSARRYFIRGRVQGVGFRNFVQKEAQRLGVDGYTRNLDDDSVEVYAIGTPAQLGELSALVRKGPRLADVRGVDEMDAPVESTYGFRIRY